MLVDRLVYAAELARGRRVLDIGGRGMPAGSAESSFARICRQLIELCCGKQPAPSESVFARAYRNIGASASEYRIVDFHDVPEGHYLIDLNERDSTRKLHEVIDDYRPEVILCMETLEHVNYHYEAMNEMAYAVSEYQASVFITLPNNGNWVLNALGWNDDHVIAFFRDVVQRFVQRSGLGRHEIIMMPCMQKYVWYWRIVYLLSFCQPFAWGFTIRPGTGQPGTRPGACEI